jgi:predicted  nucleic acid-binding Zn-ribbon protein
MQAVRDTMEERLAGWRVDHDAEVDALQVELQLYRESLQRLRDELEAVQAAALTERQSSSQALLDARAAHDTAVAALVQQHRSERDGIVADSERALASAMDRARADFDAAVREVRV